MNRYSYVETSVKKKETLATTLQRAGMILLAIIAIIVSVYNFLTFILSVIVIVGVAYFFPQLKVEYEYIFVDGQIDFDKILGGNKRKRDLRIDFEQVEIVAPEGSNSLDSYKGNSLKKKDFTSRNPDINPYVIIYRKGQEGYRILFEPSEKMIKAMKMKSPRKVIEY